jgi:hypothetical protein
MNKYLIIFLLFLFMSGPAFGQGDDQVHRSNLRIGIGLIHVRMIDEGYTDSKLLFRGTNAKFSLAYGRETSKHIFNFSITGSFGKVESKSGDLPSKYSLLEPSLEFLRNTAEHKLFGKANKFFLGIMVSSFNQAIENERVVDNISIFSLHGLYFNFCNRLSLSARKYFQVSYSMPILVFENRLLWNGGASTITSRDAQNIPALMFNSGKFTYFDVFGNIQFGLDYVTRIGQATDLRVAYKFYSVSSAIEAPLHSYSNEVMLELKIGL